MPLLLLFDVGKAITEFKKLQDKTQYTPYNKIECFNKLIKIQENIKLSNDDFYIKEYKNTYEQCEHIIKT